MATRPATTAYDSRHSLATRLVHAGLALAVVVQLTSSLVMKPAEDGKAGNLWFEFHEYGGLSAFALILLFWIVLTARRGGTPAGMLFPWVSGTRLSALWADIKRHGQAARHLRLPPHEGESPLASAVHGLGILLITAMAASGTLYYFIGDGNPDAGGLVGVAMSVHTALANLAWAYLIGHASMALLQHYTTDFNLRRMWSFHAAPHKD